MVYVFLAPGFEEVEALAPVDILRRARAEVRTVGVGGPVITGAHGIPVQCDITAAEAEEKGLEMAILPGGMPGAANLEASAEVQRLLDHCAANGLWIGAICAAPFVLGHKGLLRGRRATCYPGFETELEGAEYTAALVEQDGRYITGKGPGAALEFGFRLAEALRGREIAAKLREAMQCR